VRVAADPVALLGHLTARDQNILLELAISRYWRVDQLQRRFFPTASTDRVSQRMRQLEARGLVQHERYALDGVRRYAYWRLTGAGLALCQHLTIDEPIPYKTEVDLRLRPHFLPHCADITELHLRLLQLMDDEAMRDHLYVIGPTARVEVRPPAGAVQRAAADALVVVGMRWPNVTWTFWVEIDMGTMTQGAMARKANRIHRVLELLDRYPDPARPWLRRRHVILMLVCAQDARRDRLDGAFRKAGFGAPGGPHLLAASTPADAAAAIAAHVRDGDRRHAEEQRHAAEVAEQRAREAEKRARVAVLEQARQDYLARQRTWAQTQYEAQGLWRRRPLEYFLTAFHRLHPFWPIG